MRIAHPIPALCLSLLFFPAVCQALVTVTNMRMWQAPDHTRLVFDLSDPLEHRVFALEGPDRLVIDMDNARLRGPLPSLDYENTFLHRVRSGRPEANTLRIVLDLRRKLRPRSFVLKPNKVYGHRLVVDLHDPSFKGSGPSAPTPAPRRGDLLVAVDAGHGGEDFGASGPGKTREKDVVMAIARLLKREIDATPGMRAVLIRDGDYYISLQDRVRKSRSLGADLFVSIHADAFPQRKVRGSSVYALSQRGATSAQARFLAEKENAADLFGGVSLSDKDDLLAAVLLDLSITQTISDSLVFGADVLKELGGVGHVHIPRVEQAGFAVLKAPDVPSILVETAFISNPAEERLLRSPAFQQRMADAVAKGVRRFVARGKVLKAQVADERRHVVQPGDTLSAIARRYNVGLVELRDANRLNGSLLRVGQKLLIPAVEGLADVNG
jgi:N-acetylmuramoyl-L-alanine amidase